LIEYKYKLYYLKMQHFQNQLILYHYYCLIYREYFKALNLNVLMI